MEIIMTNKINKSLLYTLLSLFLMLASVLLIGCGDNTVTDVESLNGIVKELSISRSSETTNINGISITFTTQPSSLSSTYQDQVLESTVTTIEDYYNDNTLITAYVYSFSFTEITQQEYDLNPISLTFKIEDTSYKCNITTNLLELIYPELQYNNTSNLANF